jgi:hypothetical protein
VEDFYLHRYNTTKTAEGHQFVTTRHDMLNFLNRYEKTDSIVDQRNDHLLPINYRYQGSCFFLNGFYEIKTEG